MATALKDQVREDLMTARKAQDKLRIVVLTSFLSEIRNREIEIRRDATDDDVITIATTAIKRRREAADQMRAGGREELAAKEEQEATMLQGYLPPQMDPDEVRTLVQAAIAGGADNVGAVMKQVSPQTKGKFDGRALNEIVRTQLAAR